MSCISIFSHMCCVADLEGTTFSGFWTIMALFVGGGCGSEPSGSLVGTGQV